MCCVQIRKMFKFKYKKCALFKYEKYSIFKYEKCATFKCEKCSIFKNEKRATLLWNTKYVLGSNTENVCRSYKYITTKIDLWSKTQILLISDTKNMLISNTSATFKYKYFLFLQQTARHISQTLFCIQDQFNGPLPNFIDWAINDFSGRHICNLIKKYLINYWSISSVFNDSRFGNIMQICEAYRSGSPSNASDS